MAGKVYVLTAVRDNLEDTKKFLKSIFSQTYKNFKVFVVDDGSRDETAAFIEKYYPDACLLRANGNLWWTASLNLALKQILKKGGREDYVWIVNNDCYFGKNTLRDLYNFTRKDDSSLIGSTVLDSKTHKIWERGVAINWKKLEFTMSKDKIDALSSKGTIYPLQVFRQIGLFDEKHFPHYFSDYEFSIRAKRMGYNLKVCPDTIVYNRTARTGIERAFVKSLSLVKLFSVAFSKRSKIGLWLQFNIVRFCCPEEYRLQGYLLLFRKILSYPFEFFK